MTADTQGEPLSRMPARCLVCGVLAPDHNWKCGRGRLEASEAENARLRREMTEAKREHNTLVLDAADFLAERDEAVRRLIPYRNGFRRLKAERDSALAEVARLTRVLAEDVSQLERDLADALNLDDWEHPSDLIGVARALRLAEFETREEWGALDHGSIVEWATEEAARGNAAWLRERDPDARVMRRTIHTGPWREADS